MSHKVTFDGVARTITINLGITSVDVKSDIYSGWKNFVATDDNSKFLQALRTTGGDELPGARFIGAYFFLLNGWKLVPTSGTVGDIELDGNIFSDDGSNVFSTPDSIQLIRNVVSTQTILQLVSGSGLTPSEGVQLTELHNIHGLTSGSDLVVTPQARTAAAISQSISLSGDTVTVQRP